VARRFHFDVDFEREERVRSRGRINGGTPYGGPVYAGFELELAEAQRPFGRCQGARGNRPSSRSITSSSARRSRDGNSYFSFKADGAIWSTPCYALTREPPLRIFNKYARCKLYEVALRKLAAARRASRKGHLHLLKRSFRNAGRNCSTYAGWIKVVADLVRLCSNRGFSNV